MVDPTSSSPKILFPEWQHEYLAALLELDPKTLFVRVTVAEATIFNRLQALSNSSDGHAERQAIADALASLRDLKRHNLGFPDWEKK
jgi:hypothetical protein